MEALVGDQDNSQHDEEEQDARKQDEESDEEESDSDLSRSESLTSRGKVSKIEERQSKISITEKDSEPDAEE